MKKFLLLLTLFIGLLLPQGAFAISASPNNKSSIKIIDPDDSERTLPFSTYNINNYNYFKLRTLANYMNHTVKKFDVKYDESKDAVFISTGKNYSDYDSMEMIKKIYGDKEAHETKQKIFVDNKEIKIEGYNIEGNNYFKLRDLGDVLDFMVDYDNESNTVIINPNISSAKAEKDLNKLASEVQKELSISNDSVTTDNTFCYFPASGSPIKVNVSPGYLIEIKNSKITNFKKCKDSISIPKGTAAIYMNYANFKNKSICIDDNEVNMSEAYLNNWFKKNIFVPFVKAKKLNVSNNMYEIKYMELVNLDKKYENVSYIFNAPIEERYEINYGNNSDLVNFTADKNQVYGLAKKGKNIGFNWWYATSPQNYNEKIEHMINYALSVQGFSYDQYDCSGLVGAAADVAGFDIAPAFSWLIEGSPNVKEIPMKDLRRGDLLNKAGSHIMIYLGDGKVVESVPKTGVRVASVRKSGYKALRILDRWERGVAPLFFMIE